MQPTHLNFVAVLLAAALAMAIGFVWYGPLFGKVWQQVMEFDPDDKARREQAMKGMGPLYALVLFGTFMTAYMTARLLGWLQQDTWLGGMRVGCYLWIGLVLPLNLNNAVFSGKPLALRWKMFAVQASHSLVLFVVIGTLLGAWH